MLLENVDNNQQPVVVNLAVQAGAVLQEVRSGLFECGVSQLLANSMWSDMNFTHLQCLSELPHQVIKHLVWCWSNIEVARNSLGDLWIRR